MAYEVQLVYFRSTGKFLAYATCTVEQEAIAEIWDEIHELRRMGRLPGLRTNAGRDLYILVDVASHPQRVLHMVMPPFINEEDITPIRVPTGEVQPLVRMPMDELPSPRTTTRDVVKVEPDALREDAALPPTLAAAPSTAHDDETTPVDVPIPKPPEK